MLFIIFLVKRYYDTFFKSDGNAPFARQSLNMSSIEFPYVFNI